jgi:hypothetical protein
MRHAILVLLLILPPQSCSKPVTEEELAARREAARAKAGLGAYESAPKNSSGGESLNDIRNNTLYATDNYMGTDEAGRADAMEDAQRALADAETPEEKRDALRAISDIESARQPTRIETKSETKVDVTYREVQATPVPTPIAELKLSGETR